MTKRIRWTSRLERRRRGLIALGLGCVGVAGCSWAGGRQVQAGPDESGVNRRMQLWKIADADVPLEPTSTQPAPTQDPLTQPYHLNVRNIVRLAYHKSPMVTAAREEMVAAQHGLEEFKANLSRFEPFVEANADSSEFPERRDSRGVSGEVVGGVEKETFDGAVFRVEGGLSGSRVRFGEVEEDQEEVESGSGGVLRARIEVPFAGSRKRQDRVISSAFQESSARKAILEYLADYGQYVRSSLSHYHYALYYLNFARAYELKVTKLGELLGDPKMPADGRSRIESSVGDARVLVDEYRAYYRRYVMSLLQYLGIKPEDEYVLEEPADAPSPYLEPSRTAEGRQMLLADAYENNPKFEVLDNAIGDAELKRAQAMQGDFDITAFAEGTQFPFGSQTTDDRVGGWQLEAGVKVRLNDHRVLDSSQLKAEAEIRQYRAQIEAEQMSVQQQIATQADRLCSCYDSQTQILQNMRDTEAQFEQRRRNYVGGNGRNLTIDDVVTSLNAFITAHIRLASNRYHAWLAETALMTATGEMYRLAGMGVKKGMANLGDVDVK